MTAAFPLAWPEDVPRSAHRIESRFKTTLAGALKNVEESLRRFGTDSSQKLSNIVISSNVTLGQIRPADPGIAVWFEWMGEQRCIAVDRYRKVEENLQAVHHVIEARRTELRHGGLNIVKQTFRGFTAAALPPPSADNRSSSCWEELGIELTTDPAEIRKAFKEKAAIAHPDKGGMNADMAALIKARDEAMGAAVVE